MKEERIGFVSHYFNKIGVAAVVLEGELAVGDTIHIKGRATDFTQKLKSIQIEHKSVEHAKKNDDIAIKVTEYARERDVVYKVFEE